MLRQMHIESKNKNNFICGVSIRLDGSCGAPQKMALQYPTSRCFMGRWIGTRPITPSVHPKDDDVTDFDRRQ
jgi:hypothetical protein